MGWTLLEIKGSWKEDKVSLSKDASPCLQHPEYRKKTLNN